MAGKLGNPIKFVWKHNRVWLLVSAIVMVFIFTISMVATQNVFLRNTISTVLGGDRRVLREGDPSKYEYFSADTSKFKVFDPELDYSDTSLFAFDNSSKRAKTATLAAANRLNEKIVEEGIVLLKNKNNNALPIKTDSAKPKISVFGKNSVNLVYGGSGSGGRNSDDAKTLYDSLEGAGYDLNGSLKNFYESSASGSGRAGNPGMGVLLEGFATGETPLSSYSGGSIDSYIGDYNDAAVVVFSRIGGEGFDSPRTMKGINGANPEDHYLQLDNNEKALLDAVCNANFGKVIVVINCSTQMELGFIEDNDKIDAALWLGSPGGTGVMALGRIMNGTVNPSGRLVDTYARDFKKDPTWYNIAFNGQLNGSSQGNEYIRSDGSATGQYFVEYEEDIYVGYRYYETRAEMENDFGDGEAWYNENVVYPFGYGMSYSNFSWEIVSDGSTPDGTTLQKDGTIEVVVRVTNTGSVAGKDVVQLYYQPRFRPDGIEKAHVVLGDFAKTKELAPAESQDLTLTLDVSAMASYDWSGRSEVGGANARGYKLDAGNYTIRLGENAHASWNNSSRGSGLSLRYTIPQGGYFYDEDPVTANTVENRYNEVSNYIAGRGGYMSRNDFAGTSPTAYPTDSDKTVDNAFLNSLAWRVNDTEEDPWYVAPENMPKYGQEPADNTQLYDLIQRDSDGNVFIDYEDERWDTLLDQLTIQDMSTLIGTGNFNTARIDSIGKPATMDPDGPGGFTNFMAVGKAAVYDTCFYATECVIGATWNKDLVHDMGVMVGLEGLWGNQDGDGRPYSGWYAPAVNIHRSPFSGRNWEYYSEDPYLSGILGANVVIGAKEEGVYTYVKHFAFNDQETNRNGICTWMSEQAMREIYLRPFEIIVKVGKTTGMMSSFNRIGTIWTGGDYRLLTEILRDEWGFKGMVITDYNTEPHMYADQMIRAGGDLNLIQDKRPTTSDSALTATQVTAMRNATKNILYTVAGSNAMNGMGEGVVWGYAMPVWIILVICLNVVLFVAFAVWGFFDIRRKIKKAKAEN